MSGSSGQGEAGGGAILRAAREFADQVLAPAAMEVESSGRIPQTHLDQLAAAGLYGMAGPADHGGLDVDLVTASRIVEVLAGGCLSTAFVWLQHHSAVRAVAASMDTGLRDTWLRPLCGGQRRAGLALAGAMPGSSLLQAEVVPGGYLFEGISPWVTGWGHVDTLFAAARDERDNVVWGLIDASPGAALAFERLEMVAVMASQTVKVSFRRCFVPAERIAATMPVAEWRIRDAGGLRANGSLALGVAGKCCALLGPGPLDAELSAARDRLDAGTPQTMPAARAAASELAMRAASALLVATGSTSILASSQAQRLAREALFLLVFASRPGIKEQLSGLLRPGPAGAG